MPPLKTVFVLFFPNLGLHLRVTSPCQSQSFVLPDQITLFILFTLLYRSYLFLIATFSYTFLNLQRLKDIIASSINPASSANGRFSSRYTVTTFTFWPFLLKWNHHNWPKNWYKMPGYWWNQLFHVFMLCLQKQWFSSIDFATKKK